MSGIEGLTPDELKKLQDELNYKTAEYISGWLWTYLRIHKQIHLLSGLPNRLSPEINEVVRAKVVSGAARVGRELRALQPKILELLERLLANAALSPILERLLIEQDMQSEFLGITSEMADAGQKYSAMLQQLENLGIEASLDQKKDAVRKINEERDRRTKQMETAGQAIDKKTLDDELKVYEEKLLIDAIFAVAGPRRTKIIRELLVHDKISERQFYDAARYFSDLKNEFTKSLLVAATAENNFKIIIDSVPEIKANSNTQTIEANSKTIESVLRAATLYQGKNGFPEILTNYLYRKNFIDTSYKYSVAVLDVVDSETHSSPTLTAKATITPERWEYMTTRFFDNVERTINLLNHSFEISRTANTTLIFECNNGQPDLTAGVVQVVKHKAKVETKLPAQWFAKPTTIDVEHKKLIAALIEEMKDLPFGATVVIGNCYKIPAVAIELYKMVEAAGLKASYSRDGTRAAVKEYEAKQAGRPMPRGSKFINRGRG